MPQSERVVCSGAAELREWRERAKLSQQQLGEQLEIPWTRPGQLVNDIENGRRVPDLDMAIRIEDLTDIPCLAWRKRAA